jgi:photosystem II stability/assembly factor-like uncharacterized protein
LPYLSKVLKTHTVKKFCMLLLTAAAVMSVGSFIACHSPRREAEGFGAPDAVSSDEDAFGRLNYEWMMLRDPATGRIPDHIREKELAFAATLPKDVPAPYAKSTGTTANWQSRGPWNVGGRTRAFGIDVSNENNLIAGSCSGGMWRSTDGGSSWTMTTPSTQYPSVSCLCQDTRPGHANVWYYGTGEAYGASATATGAYYLGNGIYKSTDSGVTWSVLPATTTPALTVFDTWADLIWNIAVNPAATSQDVVYAAAYGGIYKSTDGGTTWNAVLGNTGTSSYFTDIAITSTGVVYASLSSDGTQKGIFRSADGVTFTNITPANFPAAYNRVKIGVSPANENQVYFLGNTPGYGYPDTTFTGDIDWNSLWRYTYISGDGSGAGGNWQDRSQNLPRTGGTFDKFQSQGSYDLVVKGKPNDTNVIFIGGTNLYRSTTAFADASHTAFIGGYVPGASLPVVNAYPNHHPDQHDVAFLPSNPNVMISANDGGIFKTTDNTVSSVSWTPLNNGYLTSMFYTCALDHASTNNVIIGGAQDNGSWFTNSSSPTVPWVTPRSGDGSYCAIANGGSAYYFSIQNGKMMRARLNASGGVDSFARIDPIGGTGYLFINPYVLDPNDDNTMYLAGGKYLWRNNNLAGIPYAGNWDSISTNWVRFPDSVVGNGVKISAIAVSKSPANRVYFGTSSKRLYRIDNANSGTPAPVDITSYSGAAAFPPGYISSIAVDPNNADHVMVAFSNYGVYSVFYTADGGTNWTKVAGNLETSLNGSGNGPSVRWVSMIPLSDGMVYLAGTSVGLFAAKSLDSTATVWTQQGVNTIGNVVVDMMDYRSTDGLVAVATHAHGIYSARLLRVNDVGVHNLSSEPDAGLTNYPNPFRSATTLKFNLKKRAIVSLQVLDELGRPVRVLVNDELSSGEHRYEFSAADLPPGVYYCRLKAGTFTETRRILKLE